MLVLRAGQRSSRSLELGSMRHSSGPDLHMKEWQPAPAVSSGYVTVRVGVCSQVSISHMCGLSDIVAVHGSRSWHCQIPAVSLIKLPELVIGPSSRLLAHLIFDFRAWVAVYLASWPSPTKSGYFAPTPRAQIGRHVAATKPFCRPQTTQKQVPKVVPTNERWPDGSGSNTHSMSPSTHARGMLHPS